ncbi:Transmembrane component CbiQ of energizing module of cobalt ECF transporter [invertebrate metagenome]|uniref:Transmembrane component CbiQ of energizing module of cobalt ECF transporter n=1 Tax=invertebrate metagenome TaxID=1711999 RepID=A0A484H9A5_9ZZZZ
MRLVDRLAGANRLTCRHPLEKILLACGLLGANFVVPPWPGAALVLGTMTAATVGIARLPFREWFRVLLWPMGFLVAGSSVMALTVDPASVMVSVHLEGVQTAALTSLRALAAVSCLAFLALTTPMADIGWLLSRAGMPQPVIELALLTYRFTMLLVDMASHGVTAQKARLGWQGPWQAARAANLLAAALLPRALERARRLETGLAARGFTGALGVRQRDRRPPSLGGIAIVLGTVIVVATAGVLL